jgi:hypothetical protein
MLTLTNQSKNRILTVVLVVLCLLFLASLFKNISYPLFWADESMTVMGGVRVLEFGYPKVHDGKNVLYDLQHPDKSLGIDEKTDAYIGGANWGQYYFAILGIKLAEISDDLFRKTAIIRFTFALAGLAGLMVLAFVTGQFFHSKLSKTGFLTLFVFFELISVPLVLHLREARYYSLTVFFNALAILVYARYRLLKKGSYTTYMILLIVSLFLLFFAFSPAYFIFLSAVLIFESIMLLRHLVSGYSRSDQVTPMALSAWKGPFKDYLLYILPVIFSLVSVSPLIVFFDMFHIGYEMAQFYARVFHTDIFAIYKHNLLFIWEYFSVSDFIYLAFFLKAALFCIFALKRMSEHLYSFDMSKVKLSLFLSVFFIVYCLVIAKIPNPLFTRYLIPLQPVLVLVIIVDAAVIYTFISQYQPTIATYCKSALVVIFAGFMLFNISKNAGFLQGHAYELMHQYRGPLDYVMPFIKGAYPNTENLVIATNYEETSFMYYLRAKVIIGYVGNNIQQDVSTIPDIIIYRKWWRNFGEIFRDFLKKDRYERISFSAVDFPVNNIPELNWYPPLMHRFQTPETSFEEMKTAIFMRRPVLMGEDN